MPFISKDWRSPGEEWVKTQEGWEKKKVLENCKEIKHTTEEEASESNHEIAIQPHCHITIKSTKEIAGFNELNEAVKKLDFVSACRDVRRFNYICALLHLLVGQQTTALSGRVQKALLAMLEAVAGEAIASQHNPRNLRQLLAALRALRDAERAACWGALLGSRPLWAARARRIERIMGMAAGMQIAAPRAGSRPQLLQLPEECVREVILRLADHRDLAASAMACEEMARIVGEQRVWRELAKFHFGEGQIGRVVAKGGGEVVDWKEAFYSLKRTYGISEERQYAEMLSLCRYCRCLFWRSLGHPCIADQCPEFRARLQEAGGLTPPSPVPPSDFLKFFSL